ncbi:MAG: Xaa-Pro dipeptidase [Gammaproteobacteria bacterium]|nr:Xaa-Pro dipeptidase [Gammaproteobacteria bacterium]
MSFEKPEFAAHLGCIASHWGDALAENRYDAAVVPAGAPAMYYQDDQAPPFHPNPHFARFFPDDSCAGSVLLVRPGANPKLYFSQPGGYWHLSPSLPDWADAFDVETHDDDEALLRSLVQDLARHSRVALVGPDETFSANLPLAAVNPERLVNQLVFARATKTPFEVARMREATAIGVRGHLAARDAFRSGGSEFDIHMAYLAASGQEESKLPYPNIIALNEHAGILHYQHYDREPPARGHSFLIDAGGRSGGYHADITRTYSANPGDDFDALVTALDEKQQALVGEIRPGLSYVDLHTRMHHETADLLVRFGLIRCSAESAFDRKITDAFFPHGLGHLLGLQTHDVGGKLANADGDEVESPERFPSLRYTREIDLGHVFTVEPGLYFIPMLLETLHDSEAGTDVNWAKVDALRPCGGIRIEDNVVVTSDGADNLTRPAFAQIDQPGA